MSRISQFDEAYIQRLLHKGQGNRTPQEEEYLRQFMRQQDIQQYASTVTGRTGISVRTESVAITALGSERRRARYDAMHLAEDSFRNPGLRVSSVASSNKTARPPSVVRSIFPPKPPGTVREPLPAVEREVMSKDEVARIGTGTTQERDEQFKQLITELGENMHAICQTEQKFRYFFWNDHKKKRDGK